MSIEEFNQLISAIILSGIAIGIFKWYINIILED
jgi:hypothetical protein